MAIKRPAGFSGDRDGSTNPVAVAFVSAQIEHDPVILDEGIVHQDARLFAEGSHHQIHEAVVIQIYKRRTSLVANDGEVRPHLLRNVDEYLAPLILEKDVVLFRGLAQVIYVSNGGIDVLPAVVVVVNEPNAPSGKSSGQRPESG